MKHLTVDEMTRFVSLTELNADALMLSATVNGHIRKCEKCLKRVQAFQAVYDEFVRIKGSGEFKKYICSKIQTAQLPNVASAEPTALEELDGY